LIFRCKSGVREEEIEEVFEGAFTLSISTSHLDNKHDHQGANTSGQFVI